MLHHRHFRLYWAGQSISLTGTWMQIMAQGWVVTRLTKAAWVLGALNVTSTLPILALSMVGGNVADRYDKRRVLVVTQIVLMLLAFFFAALLRSGNVALGTVFVLAFMAGVATAFDLPAAQAFPPELVPPPEIPKAVALMQAIFHGSRLVGPALAGFLVAHLGEASAFAANGASFLAVIATLLMIHDYPRRPGDTERRRGGMGAGFKYVRTEPTVRALMTLAALTTTIVFPFLVVIMLYFLRHVLQVDAQGMGIVMSASGFGSLIGAVMLLFGSMATLRVWLYAGVLGIGIALCGISLSHSMASAIPFVMVLSFSVSSTMGRISQTIQHLVPDELRGRVMGVFAIAFVGLMPYAALLLSVLTDTIGFSRTLQACFLLYTGLGLAVLMRVPRPAAAAPAREVESATAV